jgi:hypothetical protein
MWIRNINTRNERRKSTSPNYRAAQLDNNPDQQIRRSAKTSQNEI